MLRLLGVGSVVLAFAGGAQGAPLADDALRALVSGKTVYLAVPLGGEFPLTYRPDGRVEGKSPNSLLMRLDPTSDTGRWWVSGKQLCQTWSIWYGGKRYCFTLEPLGDGAVRWTRDDGLSGKARIP